jgi:CrcB protein
MTTDHIRLILYVGLFGAIGTLARLFLVLLLAPKSPHFPSGTLIVNIIGSLLIGLLYAQATTRNLFSAEMTQALGVGLIGGFTTFSSVSIESFTLLQSGRYLVGIGYCLGSSILGLSAAYLGTMFGQRL